jgi:hypothetical protein
METFGKGCIKVQTSAGLNCLLITVFRKYPKLTIHLFIEKILYPD